MEEIQQLIKDCLANNRLGQEKLYKKFYPVFFLLCRKFFNNEEEAMEVLNDGMLQVFTQLHKYAAEKGEFINWAYTVVRNVALDRIRKKRMPIYGEIEEDIVVTENNILRKLNGADIYKLLDVLPTATRAVCTLFYLEGFSIKETADLLQLSQGTVKWHLSETRSKLKPILEQYYLNK
ncbi:RNA polymerase sigma factor [Chitinophaga sp. Hz27]|uniref:RNA polymerase sigma factor n=1 Tax=Chitinophaga sp. Hz27 TaxID=3347169 RepID=UPI0035DD0183